MAEWLTRAQMRAIDLVAFGSVVLMRRGGAL